MGLTYYDIYGRAIVPTSYFNTMSEYLAQNDKQEELDKHIDLPGVSKELCQVSFDDGYISIVATSPTQEYDTKFYVGKIDPSTLKAELKDGQLHLTGKLKDKKKHIKVT